MSERPALPSLTVSFFWTFAGSVAYAGAQWAMIVLFAKLGNPAMVGQYSFAAAVAYPISLLANLQLRILFINDHEERYPFRSMLGAKYLLLALAWTALPVICLSTRANWHTTSLILVVGTAMLIDSLSDSYYAVLQKCERMDRIGRSQMLRSALCLTFSALALYITHSAVFAVCGLLMGRFLVVMLYDTAPRTFRIGYLTGTITDGLADLKTFADRFRPHWDLRSQWDMIWLAAPLGVVAVLGSFNLNIPRYVIEHYLGPRELGIYSALSYLPYVALLFASAVGYVTCARLGKMYYERDMHGFKVLLGKMVLIAAGISMAGFLLSIFAGKEILRILYRPEYATHLDLLLWLVATAAMTCFGTCVGVAMTAARQFKPQIPLALSVSVVSFALSFALIPRLGLDGAAIASLASVTVLTLGSYWVVQRALRRRMVDIEEENIHSSMSESPPVAEPDFAVSMPSKGT